METEQVLKWGQARRCPMARRASGNATAVLYGMAKAVAAGVGLGLLWLVIWGAAMWWAYVLGAWR